MDVDALIDAISKRHPIWDKRESFYSNRTSVDRCWKEISSELRIEESLLRKKWKYLRDNFAVEYGKRLQIRSGEAAHGFPPSKSKWQYFKQLMFLKDIVTPRASSLNNFLTHYQLAETDQPEEVRHDDSVLEGSTKHEFLTDDPDSELPEFREVEESEELHQDRQSSNTPVESTSISSANKRKRMSVERNVQNLYNNPQEVEEDWDLMFLKSLLPHIRLIPQSIKLQFQSQIQSVVQEYAYPDSRTAPFPFKISYAHQTRHSLHSSSRSPSPTTSYLHVDTGRQVECKKT